jgi:hypothetical protein
VPQPPHDGIVRAHSEVRGTQSFVYVMASVWRRPSLTGLEILWRWALGIVSLWLLEAYGWRVWLAATQGTADPAQVNLDHFSLQDPMAASLRVADAMTRLLPPAMHVAVWLIPLLLILWAVASALGRTAVLRRMDPSFPSRPTTLMLLGAVRIIFFAAAVALWFWLLTWSGGVAITAPASRGEEPNLVLYFALIITETLLLFIAWATASWVLNIAPLLAILRDLSAWQSLRAASQLGPLRSKLIELNLVMGIVKVALVVLAMVFSATPLPFQSFTTQEFLWCWWTGVTILYLVASDFFHVVRTASSLALCRAYDSR